MHNLLKRERKKYREYANNVDESQPRHWQNTNGRINVCKWRMNHCRIFCDLQKGSESKGKICCDLSSSGKVSSLSDVQIFGVSRNGHYAYTHNLNHPNLNQAIIDQITQQQKQCKNTYGYRRMQIWLDKNGCHRNLMKANGLLSEIRHRRRWQQAEPGQPLIGLFYPLKASFLYCPYIIGQFIQ